MKQDAVVFIDGEKMGDSLFNFSNNRGHPQKVSRSSLRSEEIARGNQFALIERNA